ncbi:hypothetical protein [Thermomonospora umbrina]|uniref:Peptidase inhibitor family I36 n=1 Tax=Thermomonospora umbrina TaxID=111806 RepID=A0A3D9SWQ1_9ACTN|nr:hypothetical protein [Thermomonospora umbrina]REF00018.1 hypothetical protein DFJ69_5538 [Thermomonospora umbrina]
MSRSRLTAFGTLGASVALAASPLAVANAAAAPKPSPTVTRPAPATAAPSPGEITTAAADGHVYAYEHADYTGVACGWTGNHNWWKYPRADIYGGPAATCWGEYNPNMLNRATSLWNNGHPTGRSVVRFWKGQSGSTPKLCLNAGDYWGNLNDGGRRFNDGSWANDEIEAHSWGYDC